MRIKGFYYFGTGAGLPSLYRNVSAMAVDFESEWMLFDCGEGTQQRIIHSDYKFSRLTHIFISHFHGDHVYGLPGLLATMQLQGIEHPLTIIGPAGVKQYLDQVFKFSGTNLKRPMNFIEIKHIGTPEIVYRHSQFQVTAAKMDHRVTCYGYRISMADLPGKFNAQKADDLGIPQTEVRKQLIRGESVHLEDGRTIQPQDVVSEPIYNPDFTYITDTKLTKNIHLLADGTDVLHHECTFTDDEADLAAMSGHVTLGQVLSVADEANVKQLQLSHFSSRYDNQSFRNLTRNRPYRVIMCKDDLFVGIDGQLKRPATRTR